MKNRCFLRLSFREYSSRDLLADLHRGLSVDIDAVEFPEVDDFGHEQEEELSEMVLVQALQRDGDVRTLCGGECLTGSFVARIEELAERLVADVGEGIGKTLRDFQSRFVDLSQK